MTHYQYDHEKGGTQRFSLPKDATGGTSHEDVRGPSLARQGVNLAAATARHVAAGRPMATDEQVAERFAICSSNECGFYKSLGEGAGKCLHKACGCTLRNLGNESMIKPQKLRWATESCPVGKWHACA